MGMLADLIDLIFFCNHYDKIERDIEPLLLLDIGIRLLARLIYTVLIKVICRYYQITLVASLSKICFLQLSDIPPAIVIAGCFSGIGFP